ncbi:glutathione S-transferase [Salinihabitans flavidus]|uniref:Glutathione S-transferase n=1 Tax=Salinihabitans flavidus TaxID=569882 RepID=A0A1H8WA29_9RHOB|nr:glutathione S-transferase N-terminal domain-containing protein [Salinihabitans flavidus]SEP24500.1 glutathione S-transferase [Salinihabitans flavidus]
MTTNNQADRDILIYNHPLSGSCHKVRMFLNMLGLPFRLELMNVLEHANQADWFGRLNPLRQIPVVVDNGTVVQDSQAILLYFALKDGPEWVDPTPEGMAAIAEWLSYAAKEVSNGPQMARLYHLAGEDIDIRRATAEGERVLAHLDAHLARHDWLCLGRPTIADIAVFPYVGLARAGELSLDERPSILNWLERIAALPGYISMPGLPASKPKR